MPKAKAKMTPEEAVTHEVDKVLRLVAKYPHLRPLARDGVRKVLKLIEETREKED